MISYELAKKLKDSGFPQTGRSHEWYSSEGELFINPPVVSVNDWVSVPTLSELIRACGKDFNFVCQHPATFKWGAETHSGIVIVNQLSPEEAVAMLYLELNK